MTRNPIFAKAAAAADHMRDMGYDVSITTHPTSYGNSAYVTVSICSSGIKGQRGFRLSDHDVGDRRKALDDWPTIIDGSDVTVADLIDILTVDIARLDRLGDEALAREEVRAARRAEAEAKAEAEKAARRAEEAAHIERLKVWLAANCPEYDSLNKTNKTKVRKRANQELYGEK
ncbi:hypothetical protein RGUI_4116 [Rhodovulum sp. P5]|uniref:hypothetical protein n=1 Tax=Rhodovulum phage vB_RhkS_P1 TaxID=1873452 RepID=UPI00080ABD59|nr:hypothetical protein [Rhodovulum sp. P5]YP_009285944.1 hypothetical protein BI026_gp59 [Rhodovulum phage vB_RhkS_P1]ANT39930.1 hypothetical protein Rhks_59 [Rhodovulum phage vB_RhkS_P1]ARE38997.1 hypothetical protein RGUI_0856 [Rhodovulum sp. P5]ARE42257.1 hypothetical protein RGUI_4116 [Rhodovulum sp. P5]